MKGIDKNFDFTGKKVTVMGFGSKDGGKGTVEFLYKSGSRITVTDFQPEEVFYPDLKSLQNKIHFSNFGNHRLKDFTSSDIIIKNDGIKRSNPFIRAALSSGTYVETPSGIFSEFCKKPYIGITGTKGKTFTAELTGHILEYCGIKSMVAGNNCRNPLRCLDNNFYPVLELSSWQLHEFGIHKKSPHIACWINFFSDHADYYLSENEYFQDKKNIIEYQKNSDIFILPFADSKIGETNTKAKKHFFTDNPSYIAKIENGVIVLNNSLSVITDFKTIPILDLTEISEQINVCHFRILIAAAVCCAVAAGCDPVQCGNAVKTFNGVRHRFEYLGKKKGISFINDSAATTPQSVILSLKSLKNFPVSLIIGGGFSKKLDLLILLEPIKQNVKFIILMKNDETSGRLFKILKGAQTPEIIFAEDMSSAVKKAFDAVKSNVEGTVLLSPSCCGAPFYRDIYQRGELFTKAVSKIINSRRNK